MKSLSKPAPAATFVRQRDRGAYICIVCSEPAHGDGHMHSEIAWTEARKLHGLPTIKKLNRKQKRAKAALSR